MAMRAFISDNAGVAANRVAVNGVIDREVSHIGIMHSPNESLERGKIFSWVAVHFNVRYMQFN